MEVKHIYWFAAYNLKGPSTRYRGYYPLQVLKNEFGIESDFVFPARSKTGILHFIKVFFKALVFRKKNSIIVIQKVCTNRIYAKLLKILVIFQTKNTLYDLDDAEYLRNDVKTLHFFLKKCQNISVGSLALKNYCKKFNKNVFILTSPITEHNIKKEKRNEVLNIGWVGDFGSGNKIAKEFSHKNNMFTILFPQIKRLKIPLKLTLIGIKNENDIPEILNYFKNNANIKINIPRNLNWENDAAWIYSEIVKFDIGVSPLSEHLFLQAKSAFKAKQYLSVGIPTIASDVGENNKFVRHNENGFLCKNNDHDFADAIMKFSEMSDDRYFEFSKNARSNKQDFSMKNHCKRLLEIFKPNIEI